MFKGNLQVRTLVLLRQAVMAAGFTVLMSSSVAAAETFFSNPDLDDLMDGDVKVARIGQRGPGVHMSFISPAAVRHGQTVNAGAVRQATTRPEVYLSIQFPW